MKDRYYEQEKVLLSIVSLCFGILVFIVYLTGTEHRLSGLDVLIGAAIGLGASLLYSLSGVLVVRLYERLRSWAYRGDARPLTGKEELRLAAFWPITLLTSLIVYLFLGIINRTF